MCVSGRGSLIETRNLRKEYVRQLAIEGLDTGESDWSVAIENLIHRMVFARRREPQQTVQ